MLATWEQAAIALFHCILECPRLHPATIDKQRNMMPIILGQDPIADRAGEGVVLTIALLYHLDHFIQSQMIEFGNRRRDIATPTREQGGMRVNDQREAYSR